VVWKPGRKLVKGDGKIISPCSPSWLSLMVDMSSMDDMSLDHFMPSFRGSWEFALASNTFAQYLQLLQSFMEDSSFVGSSKTLSKNFMPVLEVPRKWQDLFARS